VAVVHPEKVRPAVRLCHRLPFRWSRVRPQLAASSPRERIVSQPFHFAFFVRDLTTTRRFYGDVLGCREGRSTETWVEKILVPMPHFGALLGWADFEALAGRIRAAGLTFILEPTVRYAGQPGEQATMFLLDPSGNALEFKSFRHPEHVFTA
jgi:extradiol dioxygenase family protein